jgi:hypothetical protein
VCIEAPVVCVTELATPTMLDAPIDGRAAVERITVWPSPRVLVSVTVAVTVGVIVMYDVTTVVHSIGITGWTCCSRLC